MHELWQGPHWTSLELSAIDQRTLANGVRRVRLTSDKNWNFSCSTQTLQISDIAAINTWMVFIQTFGILNCTLVMASFLGLHVVCLFNLMLLGVWRADCHPSSELTCSEHLGAKRLSSLQAPVEGEYGDLPLWMLWISYICRRTFSFCAQQEQSRKFASAIWLAAQQKQKRIFASKLPRK